MLAAGGVVAADDCCAVAVGDGAGVVVGVGDGVGTMEVLVAVGDVACAAWLPLPNWHEEIEMNSARKASKRSVLEVVLW